MIRLMIVDDEKLVRQLISLIIDWEEEGFEIVGMAENAAAGLEMFRKCQPDVLFTDVRLPGETGLELVKKIKAEKPELIAVVISGFDEEEYLEEAREIGVFEYFFKPVEEYAMLKLAKKIKMEILKKERA